MTRYLTPPLLHLLPRQSSSPIRPRFGAIQVATALEVLPVEVLLRILSLLNHAELARLRAVCRALRDLASDPSLYPELVLEVRPSLFVHDVLRSLLGRVGEVPAFVYAGVRRLTIHIPWGSHPVMPADEFVSLMRAMPLLSTLEAGGVIPRNDTLDQAYASALPPTLTELSSDFAGLTMGAAATEVAKLPLTVAGIGHLTRIECLSVGTSNPLAIPFPSLVSLRRLRCESFIVSSAALVDALAASPVAATLEALAIVSEHAGSLGPWWRSLASLPGLSELAVNMADVGEAEAGEVADVFSALTKLDVLVLHGCRAGVAATVLPAVSGVTALSLAFGGAIEDDGLGEALGTVVGALPPGLVYFQSSDVKIVDVEVAEALTRRMLAACPDLFALFFDTVSSAVVAGLAAVADERELVVTIFMYNTGAEAGLLCDAGHDTDAFAGWCVGVSWADHRRLPVGLIEDRRY